MGGYGVSNGKERVLKALTHKEADRVPIDFGGSQATGIHIKAYKALLEVLGYEASTPEVLIVTGQLARIGEDILERFNIDTRGIFPVYLFEGQPLEDAGRTTLIDEWGIKWQMPKQGGFFYDMVSNPLSTSAEEALSGYKWPDAADERRFKGICGGIDDYTAGQKAIVFGGTIGNGFLQTGNWLEGFEDFLCDLAEENSKAEKILEKILEIKISFWDAVLDRWGGVLDVIQEQDDYGTQTGLIISPRMYRNMIKPRYKALFQHIKERNPDIKILFHSCGSIRPIIGDLIEIGVDALNPVQISAEGMDARRLKQDFGKDITFWGGGIDTQETLPRGTARDVEYEVRKKIEELAPGGGFVFAPVHNIQAEVPPGNLIAMWETVLKYGVY